MATASTLKDIDDKFCVCSICLEQLKEPKQLPCLHRFCKHCLRSVMQESLDVIKCPECREEIEIPKNGVDGFKTDFYSKNLVEYVQIQQTLRNDEMRECCGCSKHLRVAAYCFKCNEFLCKDCKQFHLTNKMMTDHQKHTLALEDIEGKNITIGKLALMRHAPRCHTHVEEISKLLCETCGNLPVCIACTYGKHKGHNLHEVTALAELKREELINKLKALKEIEKKTNPMEPAQAKQKLMLNVDIKKEKVINMYDKKDQKIMTKIQDIGRRAQQVKQKKQNKEKKIFDSLQIEMEQEIQQVKKRYEEILKEKKLKISHTFDERETSLEKELTKLRETRVLIQKDKEQLLESIEKQLNENVKIIETVSEHFDKVKHRYETLNTMAYSILDSENDWSAVQCIPGMCTAAKNLIKDVKRDFPKLTTLTDVKVSNEQYYFGKQSVTKVSAQAMKTISVNDQCFYLHGMTSIDNGSIVITGTSIYSSFIIVIDLNGSISKSNLKAETIGPFRHCKYLSQHKVASVREPNEIGLFDVQVGSYVSKNISDVIYRWPRDRNVTCVATDLVNKNILVGGYNSRDVYVFDDQLNYLHILTLPEMIKSPFDMTSSDDHLFVCDETKAYIITMKGLESKLVREFTKPSLNGNNFRPVSVCTDGNGFVYMLWKSSGWQCHLVQYNHDGSQVLTTREMNGCAAVITVAETSQGEKLLVADSYSKSVSMYDFTTEERDFLV